MVAMLTMPSALSERTVGTNFILNVEQFEATTLNTSNNIRVLSASDDVPQFMSVSGNVDLKNWFYWLVTIPTVSPIVCIVDIIKPIPKNYTYSINIPLQYVINASNLTWAEIRGIKSSQNISLSGLLAGSEQFDVPYDDAYTVTVYGNVSGGTCNAIATFIIDRTSEFEKSKASLAILIVIGLIAISGYTFYIGHKFDKLLKVLVYSVAVCFAYMALAMAILVEREYIKVISINSNLDNIFSISSYAVTAIAMVILVLFIANILRKAQEVKEIGKQI